MVARCKKIYFADPPFFGAQCSKFHRLQVLFRKNFVSNAFFFAFASCNQNFRLTAPNFPEGPCDWKKSIPIERVKFSIHTLEIFNPGLKISISIENFNPDHDDSPQKGAFLCGSLEIFNLDWKFQSEIGRLKISIPERNPDFCNPNGPKFPLNGPNFRLTGPSFRLTSPISA